jgi:hypothetical protein
MVFCWSMVGRYLGCALLIVGCGRANIVEPFDAALCVAGELRCSGDVLERCDGASFVALDTCLPGLCDQAGGQCDVCHPGAVSCVSTTTRRSCDAEGQSETDAECPPATPSCEGGVCAGRERFAAFDTNVDWDDAEADCVARGGHLASIHSALQNIALASVCAATSGGPYADRGCWIGMRTEVWLDGSALDFSAWSPNHMNDGPCVWIYQNVYADQWDDQACWLTVPYVCRLPPAGNTAGAAATSMVP